MTQDTGYLFIPFITDPAGVPSEALVHMFRREAEDKGLALTGEPEVFTDFDSRQYVRCPVRRIT